MSETRAALQEIVEVIGSVRDFMNGLTYAEFPTEEIVKSAVAWQLILIGNIVEKRLDYEFKTKYSKVDWYSAGGMRHHLAHECEHSARIVDWKVVWKTVTSDLPKFREQLLKIAAKLP